MEKEKTSDSSTEENSNKSSTSLCLHVLYAIGYVMRFEIVSQFLKNESCVRNCLFICLPVPYARISKESPFEMYEMDHVNKL